MYCANSDIVKMEARSRISQKICGIATSEIENSANIAIEIKGSNHSEITQGGKGSLRKARIAIQCAKE